MAGIPTVACRWRPQAREEALSCKHHHCHCHASTITARSVVGPWKATSPFHLLQVVITLAAVAYAGMALTGGALGGPGAIILGGGLALSTTAVGMQVGWWPRTPKNLVSNQSVALMLH